jgi:hypothetical protein
MTEKGITFEAHHALPKQTKKDPKVLSGKICIRTITDEGNPGEGRNVLNLSYEVHPDNGVIRLCPKVVACEKPVGVSAGENLKFAINVLGNELVKKKAIPALEPNDKVFSIHQDSIQSAHYPDIHGALTDMGFVHRYPYWKLPLVPKRPA